MGCGASTASQTELTHKNESVEASVGKQEKLASSTSNAPPNLESKTTENEKDVTVSSNVWAVFDKELFGESDSEALFKVLDDQDEGSLSVEQLYKAIMARDPALPAEAVRRAVHTMDTDSNCRIDTVEFENMRLRRITGNAETDAMARDWRDCIRAGLEVVVWELLGGKKRWIQGKIESCDQSQCVVVSTPPSSSAHGKAKERVEDATKGFQAQRWTLSRHSKDLLPVMKDRGITVRQLQAFFHHVKMRLRDGEKDQREYLDPQRTKPNENYQKPLSNVFRAETIPTWVVVEHFIKPATREQRVPFVDLIQTLHPGTGGACTATHFASHSWSSCFADLLAAVDGFGPDASIWICCFAMTQDKERIELVDDDEVFAQALCQTYTKHVLVCDPTMMALSRMWVLFELLRSTQFQKRLVLSPLKALVDKQGGVDGEKHKGVTIQMSMSGCARDSDRVYIEREMEEVGGVKELNRKVREGLLQAFRDGIAVQPANSEAEAKLRGMLAGVYFEQGLWDDSAQEHDRAMEIGRMSGIGTLQASEWKLRKGLALSEKGNHSEAVKQISESIIEEETFFYKLKVVRQLELAKVMRRKGDFRGALEVIKEARGTFEKQGDSIAASAADLLLIQGQIHSHYEWHHQLAEDAFRKSYKLTCQIFNDDSKNAALAYYNLAHALRRQFKFKEAANVYARTLQVQRQQNKEDHLENVNTRMNAAINAACRGFFDWAEEELRDVAERHPEANKPKQALALALLCNSLQWKGDHKGAKEALYQASRIYNVVKDSFGEHNELAWIRASLARSLMEVPATEEWEQNIFPNEKGVFALLYKAIQLNSDIFGKTHASVALCTTYLGQAFLLCPPLQAGLASEEATAGTAVLNSKEACFARARELFASGEIDPLYQRSGKVWLDACEAQVKVAAAGGTPHLVPDPVEAVARAAAARVREGGGGTPDENDQSWGEASKDQEPDFEAVYQPWHQESRP